MIFSQQVRYPGYVVWHLVTDLTTYPPVEILGPDGKPLEFQSEDEANRYIGNGQNLVENTTPAEVDCNWCDATVGVCHSRACPNGERYKQVQKIREGGSRIQMKKETKVVVVTRSSAGLTTLKTDLFK